MKRIGTILLILVFLLGCVSDKHTIWLQHFAIPYGAGKDYSVETLFSSSAGKLVCAKSEYPDNKGCYKFYYTSFRPSKSNSKIRVWVKKEFVEFLGKIRADSLSGFSVVKTCILRIV